MIKTTVLKFALLQRLNKHGNNSDAEYMHHKNNLNMKGLIANKNMD